MSSRQVAKVIEWGAIMQRTTDANRQAISSFKSKSDLIMSNYIKASAHKVNIDWDFYKQNISDKNWVNGFEKKFNEFKVPYPKDTKRSLLVEKKKADQESYAEFIKNTNLQIEEFKVDVDRLNGLPPVEQMTLDDIREHFPSERTDPNDPIYPHKGNSREEFYKNPFPSLA